MSEAGTSAAACKSGHRSEGSKSTSLNNTAAHRVAAAGIHMPEATIAPLPLVTLWYAVDYGSYMKGLDVAQHLEYPIHVQEAAAPYPRNRGERYTAQYS
ncbi:hypothetical protein KM043_007071 [Ampulex compressa]|nr:hypothetical protein KM043_007071 [Ampulex compressa]